LQAKIFLLAAIKGQKDRLSIIAEELAAFPPDALFVFIEGLLPGGLEIFAELLPSLVREFVALINADFNVAAAVNLYFYPALLATVFAAVQLFLQLENFGT
jgi:hypothetical protein